MPVRIRAPHRPEGGALLRGLTSEGLLLEVSDPVYATARAGLGLCVGVRNAWTAAMSVRRHPLAMENAPTLLLAAFPSRCTGEFFDRLGIELVIGGAGVDDLKQLGLSMPSIAGEVVIRLALPTEMQQVIHLRTLAYRHDGKYLGTEFFSDEFDTEAIHLCAFLAGRPIAAVRLMFPSEHRISEHGKLFDWPKYFPARTDTVEISRACVHPDFRRGRILEGLFQRVVVEILRSGRSWLLGTATDKLMPMYERIGCRATDVRIETNEYFGATAHTVFVSDVRSTLLGSRNPVVWLFFWRKSACAMLDDEVIIPRSLGERWRLGLLRSTGSLIDLVTG